MTPTPSPPCRPDSGATFIEVLIAASIAAAVIVVAVIAYGSIARLPARGERFDVTLPAGAHNALYGAPASYVTVGPVPNYAEAIKAREMKDILASDVNKASGVFCLGRDTQPGGVRPATLSVPDLEDFRKIATPQAFYDFLYRNNPGVASPFSAEQSGALASTNATIFILSGLNTTAQVNNSLYVIATYEVDFVAAVSPSGTLASVRRYAGTAIPTHFFHVFYPDDDNSTNAFRPLAVFFGREATPSPSAFDVAPNRPFTFAWWPDPLVGYLSGRPAGSSDISPRSAYANMAGRTSFFFVLPTFPSL